MIKKVFSIILISLFVFSVYAQAAENTEENPVQDTAAVEAEIKERNVTDVVIMQI